MSKYRLLGFHPNHLTTYGIGHAAMSIVEAMNLEHFDCTLMVPSADRCVSSKYVKCLIPQFLIRIFYKFIPHNTIKELCEFLFLLKIKPNDIVYIWPGTSVDVIRKVKEKGNIIIVENINCHQKISKQILDSEAKCLGLQNTHLITQTKIEHENEVLDICDYVFSPSPLVTQSLLDSGVDANKILTSSYGLHEYQQFDRTEKKARSSAVDVIFVGRVGMRKGVHLLLEYWQSAKINGTLKIVGNIEDSIRDLIEPYWRVENIQFIDFMKDIDSVYKNADFFVLPSLEEGSPLVTYLALGAGLPCIVSPMGGQGVVTHNEDGFVIDPHNKSAWVTALQKLADSSELRHSLSLSARKNSNKFLWKHVGRHRTALLLEKLKGK